MRKLLVAMFMTAMLAGVVGCGGEKSTPAPKTPEAAPPAETPAPPAEPEK